MSTREKNKQAELTDGLALFYVTGRAHGQQRNVFRATRRVVKRV